MTREEANKLVRATLFDAGTDHPLVAALAALGLLKLEDASDNTLRAAVGCLTGQRVSVWGGSLDGVGALQVMDALRKCGFKITR